MTQVVITGWSAISGLGNDNASFGQRLGTRESSIAPLPHPLEEAGTGQAARVELANKDMLRMPHCRGLRPGTMTRYSFLSTAALAQCLDSAGFEHLPPETAEERGVYAGSYTNTSEMAKYARLSLAVADPAALQEGTYRFDSQRMPAAMKRFTGFEFLRLMNNMPVAHGAIHAQCKGPSQTFLGHPLAGLQAIGRGQAALKADLAKVIFAGGTGTGSLDLMLVLRSLHGWSAPLGSPLPAPFDKDALGTTPGEGSAFLCLETTDNAQDRGAKAIATVAGYSSRWCGRGDSWDSHGALAVAKSCLDQAQWTPDDVDLLGTHGMSLPQNDQREAELLLGLFADCPPVLTLTRRLGFCEAAHGNLVVSALLHSMQTGLPPALERTEHPRLSWADPEPNPRRVLFLGVEPGGQVLALALQSSV